MDDIMLLKVGRHMRPKPQFKLIIARDAGESKFLQGYRKQYTTVQVTSHKGPFALVDGDIQTEDYEIAAALVARYGQGRDEKSVEAEISAPGKEKVHINVTPLSKEEVKQEWHV